MRPTERLAIVVVTYNSADLIAGLVRSLEEETTDVDWTLTVVDNASSDGTPALARRLTPEATVIETGRNGGYAAGINAGVASLDDFTAVLVLNPDVRLTPGCIEQLLATLRTPGTGIAVPRLLDAQGELIASQRREPTVLRALADAVLGARRAGRIPLLGEVVTDPSHYDRNTLTDWAEGSTMLISAECLSACGPWDERFFLYSEETDYALRARDAGFATRYTPDAVAIHLEGGSATSPALWPLLVTNRVRLFRLRHGRVHTFCFWMAVVLREGSRAVLGKRTNRAAFAALVSPRRMFGTPGPDWLRN